MNKIKDILANIGKVEVGTWVRFALVLLSIVNRILLMAGVNTLPFTDEEISALIGDIFMIIVMLNAFWKNNSFTAAALAADKVMKNLRKQGGKFDA